jgi:hypothetical protein
MFSFRVGRNTITTFYPSAFSSKVFNDAADLNGTGVYPIQARAGNSPDS